MVSRKLHRNTLIKLNCLEICYYNSWYYSICINDVFRHRLQLLKCLPLKMLLVFIIRIQFICLGRSHSPLFLVVFKLNNQVKGDKGGNGKGRKKGECFTFPSFIKNLEKAYTRGSADNTGHAMLFILFSSNAFWRSYSLWLLLIFGIIQYYFKMFNYAVNIM